jgi:hypothetical protein
MQNKLSPQIIKNIAAVSLLVVAVALLAASRGFRYTSYNFSYVVQASGQLAEAVISDAAGKAGVARVDRTNNTVYFQEIGLAQFNQMVTTLQEQYKDKSNEVQIKSFIEQPTPVFTTGSNQMLFALGSLVALFYLYRIVWKPLDRQDRPRIILVILLGLVAAAISAIGLVSLLSQFTMVSEVTTFLAILGIIMTFLVLLWSIREYIEDKQLSRVDAALDRITAIYYTNYRQLLRFVVVAVLILMLALGFRFVLDGAVMLVAFFVAGEVLVLWIGLWYQALEFDWRHIGGQINVKQTKKSKTKSK